VANFIHGGGEGLAMGAAQGLYLDKVMGVFMNWRLTNLVLQKKVDNFIGKDAPPTPSTSEPCAGTCNQPLPQAPSWARPWPRRRRR
jgi:hypothetical protein